MKRAFIGITAAVALAAFGITTAMAEGIPEKMKSKKVLGDLVAAYKHADPETQTLNIVPGSAVKKTYDTSISAADGTQCSSTAVRCACEASGGAPDGTPDGGDNYCTIDADCGVGGNTCCGNETCADTEVGGDCEFQKGKFKTITGKDPQFQIGKIRCGIGTFMCEDTGKPCTTNADCNAHKDCIDTGVYLPEPTLLDPSAPIPAKLCAQTEALATIMDEDIDKFGGTQARTCLIGTIQTEGTTNYSVTQEGLIECKKGNCKGVLVAPTGPGEPCPDTDKLQELRHARVTDGDLESTRTLFGNDMTGCCFPGVVVGGGFALPGCYGQDQDILAEMGTVTQHKAPAPY